MSDTRTPVQLKRDIISLGVFLPIAIALTVWIKATEGTSGWYWFMFFIVGLYTFIFLGNIALYRAQRKDSNG